MDKFYTARMLRYVEHERLPLWVEYVPVGYHDECLFHDHEFSEIALVLHGSAIHLANHTSAPIKAGDVLLLHPGISHGYDHTGDMELINIIYDRATLSLPVLDGYSLPMFDEFFPIEPTPPERLTAAPVMSLGDGELQEVKTMIRRLEDELKNFKPGNFFLSLALFMEIIVLLARHEASTTPEHRFRFQIGEVIGYMNRHLKQPIEVEKLVAISNMSRRNLFRKFKQSTGYSPIEYLQQIRLQRALELLQRSNLTINEIALESGFSDSNYFCRVFRQNLNLSPRRFRLDHQSGKLPTGHFG